ncbi:DUF4199 domain-containing protein [Gracilimonas mengyeensis]|uniref:DUF4199 domain-containing protein n=1 Tax=Gracilimonas mengyeensis TaxID=1302730 RepID=A0A521E5E9_9BACT|nr:DUF4199 domain-containing protein [Gracilimonas mengyeensis]SMO79159.1 Protein of unknown function [Gracilimonas mengyeensis]
MNKYKTELKWGLIFAGSTLIWMLLERVTGLHDEHISQHMLYTNLFAIVAITLYVLALRDKRENDLGGDMTYKQGFISGLIITVIVTVLSPLTQYLSATFIAPDYFQNMIEFSVQEGYMAEEDASNYFSLSNYVKQSIIGAFVLGVLTSAIVAFFTKSNAPSKG